MIDEKFSRRQLLQGALVGLAAVPAATSDRARSDAAEEALSEADPTAKQFGYVSRRQQGRSRNQPDLQAGPDCANCLQFKPARPELSKVLAPFFRASS